MFAENIASTNLSSRKSRSEKLKNQRLPQVGISSFGHKILRSRLTASAHTIAADEETITEERTDRMEQKKKKN